MKPKISGQNSIFSSLLAFAFTFTSFLASFVPLFTLKMPAKTTDPIIMHQYEHRPNDPRAFLAVLIWLGEMPFAIRCRSDDEAVRFALQDHLLRYVNALKPLNRLEMI